MVSLIFFLDGDDIGSKLFPNVFDFVAVLLAFIILVIAVFFLAYKPVKKLMKKRADYVRGRIQSAEEREDAAKKNVVASEALILSSKKDAAGIIAQAKEDALKERAVMKKTTDELIMKQKEEAAREIARELEASRDKIRKDIVDVALSASEKVLGRTVNEADAARLVDDFIEDLEKTKEEKPS